MDTKRKVDLLLNDNRTIGTWLVPPYIDMEEIRVRQDEQHFCHLYLKSTRPMVREKPAVSRPPKHIFGLPCNCFDCCIEKRLDMIRRSK